jgi:ATP-dependent RNA helicase DHX29
MAKKKKTQLKPVARGFATTSVPKKATQTEEEIEVGVVTGTEEEGTKTENDRKPDNVVSVLQNEEFDLDKVEEQSLQNLVDRLQEKTEREVSRTIKVLI